MRQLYYRCPLNCHYEQFQDAVNSVKAHHYEISRTQGKTLASCYCCPTSARSQLVGKSRGHWFNQAYYFKKTNGQLSQTPNTQECIQTRSVWYSVYIYKCLKTKKVATMIYKVTTGRNKSYNWEFYEKQSSNSEKLSRRKKSWLRCKVEYYGN